MIKKAAIFDAAQVHRYRLERIWDDTRRPCVFVMLNPSTADADKDDATIRACVRMATLWNYGGIIVVNLYAYRATDPRQLKAAGYPIGAENDEVLWYAAAGRPVICAWGNHAQPERAAAVLAVIRQHAIACYHLGLTKQGQPRHPLYAPSLLYPWETNQEDTCKSG